ncbi:MAG: hypothetical protein QE283_05140 [Rhodoferax sp.]|nr:hypothetical protein [Rhodoferax sp.]
MESYKAEITAIAARLVVEEGLDFGTAKRRAAKQTGAGGRATLPDNLELEEAVEEYIAIFCADTQPAELRALREIALHWMQRLAQFRPHLGGAVWHGTATRKSDIYLQLFCDDGKAAEIALIDMGVRFDVRSVPGLHGAQVDALSIHVRSETLQENIGLHLLVYDLDDIRGALQPDARGRSPRGDTDALRRLIDNKHP